MMQSDQLKTFHHISARVVLGTWSVCVS